MKGRTIAILAVALFTSQLWAQEKPGKKVELKTLKDKASYAFGMSVGSTLKRQAIDIDVDLLSRGIRDAISGGKTLLNEEEADQTMQDFRDAVVSKQSDVNKKAEDAFLAANGKKEGVKTLPSGLQYKILKKGTGPKPTINDSVVAHYRGTLIDGTEFDSSYKRGAPATFPVKEVIRGWTEALQLMEEGSKWQLYVPARLAYAEEGRPPVIGPNATLLFEVELVKIAPGQASKLPRLKSSE